MSHAHDSAHPTPLERLIRLLAEDRSDLIVLLVYTALTGLLSLATPLAVQSLVNYIAAGVSLQPLVATSLLVLLGLLTAGGLALAQLVLVECVQQRVFARTALRMAGRLIRSRTLMDRYGPELANRFFDILTIQKALAKLLLDGIAAALGALAGLVLLALYDPSGLLFGFDLLLVLFLGFVIVVLGIGGLRTSLAESNQKYRVAGWLEELARCHMGFKLHAAPAYLMERADQEVLGWLRERRRHFAVTLRQEAGNQLFQALASAGVLALGGYLVIQREITLGQLVAAQIVVAQVLKATDKLIRQAEVVYDLLTGLDKTGYITDLPAERPGGRAIPSVSPDGARVLCRDVRFHYPGSREVLMGLDLTLEPGERISLVGASGAGKSTLAALLCGLEEPTHGLVEVNGIDVREAELTSLRQAVTVVGYSTEIFDGTIEENLIAGREGISRETLRWAKEIACLTDDIALMPDGLQTRLVTGGKNLSRGQIQRLLIARALLDRPQLLILDEALTGIDERMCQRILDRLFDPANGWTIIDISHDASIVLRADRVFVLADGRIVESGTPEELLRRAEGEFSALFPAALAVTTRRRSG